MDIASWVHPYASPFSTDQRITHRNASKDAYRRKSFHLLTSLLSFKADLDRLSIPFVCTVTTLGPPQCVFNFCKSVPNGVFCMFTDDNCYSHIDKFHLDLLKLRPSLPMFCVDSNSLITPRQRLRTTNPVEAQVAGEDRATIVDRKQADDLKLCFDEIGSLGTGAAMSASPLRIPAAVESSDFVDEVLRNIDLTQEEEWNFCTTFTPFLSQVQYLPVALYVSL